MIIRFHLCYTTWNW